MESKFLDSAEKKSGFINTQSAYYGTFAEIGAGQETVRFFFQQKLSSQTVAKSISAYDMGVSTDIYGSTSRYVSRQRLEQILSYEKKLLEKRLENDHLFVFANTVATSSRHSEKSHGWLGLEFKDPKLGWSQVVVHVNLDPRARVHQQYLLGVLGVNLMYASFFLRDDLEHFLKSLMDELSPGDVQINYIQFGGGAFQVFDERRANLMLVKEGYCPAMLFDLGGEPILIQDEFFDRELFIMRDFFRPVLHQHINIMEEGLKQWKKESKPEKGLSLFEIPRSGLKNIRFALNSVDMIRSMGYQTLVTSFESSDDLVSYLSQVTSKQTAFVVDASALESIFSSEKGKLLPDFLKYIAGLFRKNVTLYVYPHKSEDLCLTSQSFIPSKPYWYMYELLKSQGLIRDISNCDEVNVFVLAEKVRKLFETGDEKWKEFVPTQVQAVIEKNNIKEF